MTQLRVKVCFLSCFDPWFLQSTAGASLLANASPLTLMTSPLSVTNQNMTPFGMLGGLVPVTMPFQFPLELLGFGTDTAGVTATTGSTSAAFHHSLTHSKWPFTDLDAKQDRTGNRCLFHLYVISQSTGF